MKNGNQFITVQGAAEWSYDHSLGDIRHIFSTLTRALWKYPLLKVAQMSLIFQQIKSWPM